MRPTVRLVRSRWGVCSDIGGRSSNQDSATVRSFFRGDGASREEVVVAMVADGMGGEAAGEVASGLAVDTVLSALHSRLAEDDFPDANLADLLEQSVKEANDQVYAASLADPECGGMGTTLTVLAVAGDTAYGAHVGDSRAYLLRGGRLRQLTRDQTLAQKMLEDGLLTPQEAARSETRHRLLEAVGTAPEVQVDTFTVSIHQGDVVFLATDGAWDALQPDDYTHAVGSNGSPQAVVEDLVERARIRDGSDNLTMVCLQFGRIRRRLPPPAPRTKLPWRLTRVHLWAALVTTLALIAVVLGLATQSGDRAGMTVGPVRSPAEVPPEAEEPALRLEVIMRNSEAQVRLHYSGSHYLRVVLAGKEQLLGGQGEKMHKLVFPLATQVAAEQRLVVCAFPEGADNGARWKMQRFPSAGSSAQERCLWLREAGKAKQIMLLFRGQSRPWSPKAGQMGGIEREERGPWPIAYLRVFVGAKPRQPLEIEPVTPPSPSPGAVAAERSSKRLLDRLLRRKPRSLGEAGTTGAVAPAGKKDAATKTTQEEPIGTGGSGGGLTFGGSAELRGEGGLAGSVISGEQQNGSAERQPETKPLAPESAAQEREPGSAAKPGTGPTPSAEAPQR